jgi:hypothetical protein
MSTARAKLGLAMRGRFAVDQPTINGRSCLDPDSIEAASVPVAVVAQQHDTSVREIEAHYAWITPTLSRGGHCWKRHAR